jgi:MoxR-like ATPase
MPQLAGTANTAQEHVASFADRVADIRKNLHQVVVGQDASIDLLLTCALTGSHALLVGVPGLAKTLMVKALAAAYLAPRQDSAEMPVRVQRIQRAF